MNLTISTSIKSEKRPIYHYIAQYRTLNRLSTWTLEMGIRIPSHFRAGQKKFRTPSGQTLESSIFFVQWQESAYLRPKREAKCPLDPTSN